MPHSTDDLLASADLEEDVPDLTLIEQKRFGRWWGWRIEGASVPEICRLEQEAGESYCANTVRKGLRRYAAYCADASNRAGLLTERLHSAYQIKRHLHHQIADAMAKNQRNGNKGLPIYEQRIVIKGGEVEKHRKITYTSVNAEVNPMLRLLLDTEKHIATLQGLMSGEDVGSRPDLIEFDLGDFFDSMYETPDEAPQLQQDTKPLPMPSGDAALAEYVKKNGADQNPTNGTDPPRGSG